MCRDTKRRFESGEVLIQLYHGTTGKSYKPLGILENSRTLFKCRHLSKANVNGLALGMPLWNKGLTLISWDSIHSHNEKLGTAPVGLGDVTTSISEHIYSCVDVSPEGLPDFILFEDKSAELFGCRNANGRGD
jgi:hypothetical protein